ncbi:MAG: hypothetical protein Fur0022_12360 [Anaerolineales bacterium]
MKSLKLTLSILVLVFFGIGTGLVLSYSNILGRKSSDGIENVSSPIIEQTTRRTAPVFISSYAYTPFDETLKKADVIFVGQITNIGETKWNQDSGEYWEETIKDEFGETTIPAQPYFEVTISPLQLILDTFGVDGPIVVSVLENSPLDSAGGDFKFKIGDEIIAFVSQHEIAWYYGEVTYNNRTRAFESGKKSVLLFTAAPNQSSLVKNEDGLYQLMTDYEQVGPFSLDEVILLVQEERATPQTLSTSTLIPLPIEGPAVIGDGVEIEMWEYLGPEAVEAIPIPSETIRNVDVSPYQIRLIRTDGGFELVWGALLCSTQPVIVVSLDATIEFWPGQSTDADCVEMEVFHKLTVQWQTDIPFEEWKFIFHPPPPPEA